MCGIVAAPKWMATDRALDAIEHRGPDGRGKKLVGEWTLGHVRLALRDRTCSSAQPFKRGKIVVSFNGEIWGYESLRSALELDGEKFETDGDTEVMACVLDKYGIDGLDAIEGMFAVAWTDGRSLWCARDKFGEIPIHFCGTHQVAASEMKAMMELGCSCSSMLQPGSFVKFEEGTVESGKWYLPQLIENESVDVEEAADSLRQSLMIGVSERVQDDLESAFLLSGGIDSSAICSIACSMKRKPVLYTAVFNEKSADLRKAREVAEFLGLKLNEVKVKDPSVDDLLRTVDVIEQSSSAQVEIAWACLALADAIRSDGFKVVMSGEGSDELWASYGFAYHGIKKHGWYEFRRKLFESQAWKNFPRCNKVFMSRGVECRLPFLNENLVEDALSWSMQTVRGDPSVDKLVMREAFNGILPKSVIKRNKVAFQIGLGLKDSIRSRLPSAPSIYRNRYSESFKIKKEESSDLFRRASA